MKKFKKALLSILSLALVAVLSIGGTLAYLKSEDSDVNVMTMGNVKIAQHEYERAENEDGSYKTATIDNQTSYVLKEFTQDKMLLPIVGDPSSSGSDYAGWDDTTVRMSQVNSYGGMQVFAGKVAQDKFVTVENTGKNDAYIRTIIAVEVGTANPDLVGTSFHMTWGARNIGIIEANGTKYYVTEYLYNGANGVRHDNGVLPAGDTSYPNLSQVYLKSETTNEDVEAIDGNKNGRLDILVLSQAVQTSGFNNAKEALDRAFGETTTAKAAEWFDGMTYEKIVYNINELNEAMPRHKVIILGDTINADYINNFGNDVTIYGNDKEINSGTAVDYAFIARAGSNTTFNNVNLNSLGGGIAATAGAKVTFNGKSVYVDTASTSGRYLFYAEGAGSEITINGGKFSWDPTDNQKRAYIYAAAGTTVYVNGGEFGKASTRDGYTAGILGEGTVIIKGGTFGFDPSAWVASGYVATKTGSTWTVDKA